MMTGLPMRWLWTGLTAAFFLAALPSVSPAADQRVAHTATLLTSGDILLAGGINQAGTALATAELFAASIGNVILPTGGMGVARASHTATLMTNGCVLVAGGNVSATDAGSTATAALLIYNPATSAWAAPVGAANMGVARYNHTSTLLNDGRVLICGGQNSAGAALIGANSCEIYTPTSCTNGTIAAGPNILQGRYNHTAVLLKDGKVWLAGGSNPAIVATGGYLVTTERFDPVTNAFQSASPMIEARAHHTATLMGDGKALVVGGYNLRDVLANKGITQSAEIYDPISNTVSPAAVMSARRQAHASVLSANGQVTVFGGLGNITTTYVLSSDITIGANVFGAGSTLVTDMTGGVVVPTATINSAASTGFIDLDLLLNKPVIGEIANGEIWLSSPSVMASWGAVRFLPASETNPAVGLRINLAGTEVGCRLPSDGGEVAGNCGNILASPTVGQAALSQMQGQVVYYPRLQVASAGDSTVSGGLLNFSGTINSANVNATITAGSSFTTVVRLPMDVAFDGRALLAGTYTLTAAELVQPSSFTVTLTGGTVAFAGPIALGTDASGNPELAATVTFTNLAGSIEFTGIDPQSFPSGQAIPQAGANMAANGIVGNLAYTMNGAVLDGAAFEVGTATVVIRKMLFADAETYNPKANSWTLAPPPGVAPSDHRYGHSATLLPNNDRLFYGGRACSGATCATQVATPALGFQLLFSERNFALTAGSAAQARAFHTSTLLPGGDILVAGGTNGPSILSHAELFTPGPDTFSPINDSMRYVRDLHTATLLPNGRVLVAGGFTTNAASTGSTNTAEIYYPDTKRFIETSPMISSRSNHTAILLPDGRVFVAGGFGTGDVITGNAEIFLSTMNVWMPVLAMPGGCERAIHAATQLRDGRILLFGGVNASGPLSTVARYDPAANTWDCGSVTPIGTGTAGGVTPLRSHTATVMLDGRVLIAGGNDGLGEANKSYIYNPVSNTWTLTDPLPLLEPRFNHTATALPNGNVMITGGSQKFGNIPRSIETYHVNASSWVTGGGVDGVSFASGERAFHTMTLALNNKMYGIGGSDGVIGGAGVSLYASAENGHFTATPDAFSKDAPPSFRQSTITGTSATPFLPGTSLTVTGTRFRGGTEASGGGAASANSAFSFPHMVLTQVDGSGGAASQSNGGFTVDLTTQIFLNAANSATLDTSLTVALPATSAGLPFGWYTLRMGANDIYSEAKMLQVGPAKPTLAPANVTGVAAGISSMTWTWDRIVGVDGYNVYNATTGVFLSSIAANALLPRSTFYQTGLAPSATTSILVAGYTLTGDGPLTSGPTSYTLPTVPVGVTIASVTFSDLLLFWGTNGNAFPGTSYEVTQSSDNFVSDVSTPVPKLFDLTTNFTIISNLAANTTYYFRVRAFNLVNVPSSYSAVVSTRTRAPVTQPIVSGRTTTSITWGWADPGGVTSYRVYNATNNVLLGTPVLNSFTEVGLATNTLNSIVVSAITNAGEGPLSPSASAYTMAATPGTVNPPVPSVSTRSFTLVWTNNDNPLITNYALDHTRVNPDGTLQEPAPTIIPPPLTFSVVFEPLAPSTLYNWSIVGVNGDDIDSDTPRIVVGSTWTLPTDPNPLTVLDTSPTTISVGWSANNNSSSATYQVTYSTDDFTLNISTAISFAAKFNGTSATIPGLVTGATYSVRVIASNPFGRVSQFSNTVTTRTFNGGAPAGALQGPMSALADSAIFGSLGNQREVSLRAAAQTFPSDVIVRISPATGTLCSAGTNNLAFEIIALPALQPAGSLYFTFDYFPGDLGGIPASRALLLRHDPGSGACVPLETTIDAANRRMTARINHFSLFQVGQVPLSTTAETARVFPNPYYTGRDGFVTLDNVPPGARVRIFTLRGEQVLDVKANATGLLTWSGTNGSGRAVATGVYLVMVESGGTKKILKLAVIR